MDLSKIATAALLIVAFHVHTDLAQAQVQPGSAAPTLTEQARAIEAMQVAIDVMCNAVPSMASRVGTEVPFLDLNKLKEFVCPCLRQRILADGLVQDSLRLGATVLAERLSSAEFKPHFVARLLAHTFVCVGTEINAQADVQAPGAAPGVIRIGHVGPISGRIAHLGKDNENGARLAVEEINERGVVIGGKTLKIELVTDDDASDPARGVAAAQRLVNANVHGGVGHLNSGTSIPASKLYRDAGIPQISPSSTNPKYTRQGYHTAFRIVADDAQLGIRLGRYAMEEFKPKAIAIIDDRTAYGQGLAEIFKKAVQDADGKVVAHETTHDRATDFTAILATIKGKTPNLVFFGGMDAVAGPMLRQMRQLGIGAKFLGGDGICSSELIGLAGAALVDNQVVCAEAGGVEEHQSAGMETFNRKFKTRFGTDVQVYAPYVYDAVYVMVAAMVKADSSDPAKYLPALAKTEGFKGVTGSISFDERGDIKNGTVTLYNYRRGKREQIAVIR